MVSGLQPTVGSVKKPGTYERIVSRSGVINTSEPQMTRKNTIIPAKKISGSPYITSPGTPADASFVSGGSRSGEGGVTTNTATNTASVNMVNAVNRTASQNLPTVQQKEQNQFGEIMPGTTGTARGELIFVTPSEKARMQGTTLPLWETTSPNTPSGMVNAINVESMFAGTVNTSTVGAPIVSFFKGTKVLGAEEQQYNIRQINRTQESLKEFNIAQTNLNKEIATQTELFYANPESFRGSVGFTETAEGYSLSPEYFKTLRTSAVMDFTIANIGERYAGGYSPSEIYKAREQTKGLGLSTGLATIETSFEKVGIGIARGIVNYPMQMFQATGTSFKDLKTPAFTFGSTITNIPSEPSSIKFLEHPFSYIGETLLERPTTALSAGTIGGTVVILGTGAIKNIGELGFKGGITESLRLFSPIRIPSGKIFQPDLTKTKFEGQAVKIQREGISETYFKGNAIGDTNIKLVSYQISGKTGAVQIGIIEVPQYTILRGSTTPIRGTGSLTFATNMVGKPVNYGFVGTATSVPLYTTSVFPGYATANIFPKYTPITTKVGGVEIQNKNLFAFTSGKIVQGFYRTGFTDLGQQTFEFAKTTKVNLRGIGLNINIPSGGSGVTFITGGGKITGFGGTKLVGLTTTVPTIIQIPKLSTASFSSEGLGGFITSAITGQKTKTETKTKTTQFLESGQIYSTLTRQKVIFAPPETTTIVRSGQSFSPALAQPQIISTPTQQVQTPIYSYPTPGVTVPNYPTVPSIIGGGGLFVPFIPSFDFGNLPTRRYKNKQKKKYTPSFETLIGFAKGSTKKQKGFTGLEIRGVPKNFNWAFNKPKIKFRGFRL